MSLISTLLFIFSFLFWVSHLTHSLFSFCLYLSVHSFLFFSTCLFNSQLLSLIPRFLCLSLAQSSFRSACFCDCWQNKWMREEGAQTNCQAVSSCLERTGSSFHLLFFSLSLSLFSPLFICFSANWGLFSCVISHNHTINLLFSSLSSRPFILTLCATVFGEETQR